MGRSEVIILGWLMVSLLSTDTTVTSTQCASKDPAWPRENELLFLPWERQKERGIGEAVSDKSII